MNLTHKVWFVAWKVRRLAWATVTGMKRGLNVPTDINPFIAHPANERLYHTIGIYAPYSLRTAFWVLWRSTRIRTVKELWDRAYGFLSLSEKTIITIVDVTRGSPFSSVISRPWVLIWLGFEPPTFRSADRRLSNWANRGVVTSSS